MIHSNPKESGQFYTLGANDITKMTNDNTPEGKFLVPKFKFGGSFGMSLEGGCNEFEATLSWTC